jgi:CelD/BcsL family acetyltransferase involved in cellulose biosynthesis
MKQSTLENADPHIDIGRISWSTHSTFPEEKSFVQQWNHLAETQVIPGIFVTYDWIKTWWNHFGADKRLVLLSGTYEKRLVALAPMMITKKGPFSLQGPRIMEFIGTGSVPTRGMGLSDRVDFLYAGNCHAILDEMLDRLYSLNPHFDLLLIRALSSASPTFEQLKRNSEHYELSFGSVFRSFSPYTEIKGSWESFLSTKSGKTRRQWRNSRRRLKRTGKYELSRYPDNGWSFKSTMKAILTISRHSYKWEEQNALLQSSALLNFYTEFYRRISRKGFFKVHFILMGGEPVAYQAGFQYANRLFAYDTAYDKSHKDVHPGIHLVTQGIRTACGKNLVEYDMMRGDEPYKNRWCSDRREEIHFVAYHRSLKGKITLLLFVRLRELMKKSRRIRSFYEKIAHFYRGLHF